MSMNKTQKIELFADTNPGKKSPRILADFRGLFGRSIQKSALIRVLRGQFYEVIDK